MAVAEVLSDSLTDSAHRSQLRRAVIASTVGTTIEWYDFLLYSVVTGLVFGKLFFPKSEPLVGVLQAFAVYAVGFLARPMGAAIFGHYGDRIGRKATLIATLLGTGPAFALGNAQTLYMLPVSLFGMSISAARPPMTRRASCGPIAVLIATPRPL